MFRLTPGRPPSWGVGSGNEAASGGVRERPASRPPVAAVSGPATRIVGMTDNTMALDRESPSGENAVPGLGSSGWGSLSGGPVVAGLTPSRPTT